MENIVPDTLYENDHFDDASHLVDVEGMSSPRICNLLNGLVAEMPSREAYLEVGTWKGLTLLSAAYDNHEKQCIACDKFRFWAITTGFGYFAERDLRYNLERYRKQTADIEFHSTTFQDLFDHDCIAPPVGVYFYDGAHDWDGTYRGVIDAQPYYADSFILLMDDWNVDTIRDATHEACADLEHDVTWQRDLFSRGDGDEKGWWNGLGLFYLER